MRRRRSPRFRIEASARAYLNGRFEGLATESQDNRWGYDGWLLMWLSTPAESAPRFALTTLAEGL